MYKHFARMQSKYPLLALVLTLISAPVYSYDLLINGFGTVCASKSDLPKEWTTELPAYPFLTQLGTTSPYVYPSYNRPSYLGAERRVNYLANSKFGLQFTNIFNAQFKAIVQLIGRAETMNSNNYYVRMDWAYLQYNYNNDLDFQFGRFRLPIFYYSDYLEVNHAQPWVTPPEEVYYIAGNAFRNVDGIKARYSYYLNNWTIGTQLFAGSAEENISILSRPIDIKVRDLFGGILQIENDFLTLRGSALRSIYDTNLYDPLQGLVTMTNQLSGSTSPAASNLSKILDDTNVSIIYVGLALAANWNDFNLLIERASILSPGIISSARVGSYASLTYAWKDFAFTFTLGKTRPLQTEVNKYNAVQAFFATPQYMNSIENVGIAPGSGAGAAVVEQFYSYLSKQTSYGLDVRYDILPSLALKGSVKYLVPKQQGPGVRYLFTRVATVENVWVYRASFDFVF